MPRDIPAPLASMYASGALTAAPCWKLSRKDGVVLGFTAHDRNIVFDGVTYQALSGMAPTQVKSSSGTVVDNLSVMYHLDTGAITEADVLAGAYDGAEVELFLVDWANPAAGKVALGVGYWGEVQIAGGRGEVEHRSLIHLANSRLGRLCSPACPWSLGDANCKVNLAPHTMTGVAITAVTNARVFHASALIGKGTDYYNLGRITFTSGPNAGQAREIKTFDTATGEIALNEAFRREVQIGNQFSIVRGCDRTLQTCREVFSNAVNYGGQPYIPGLDEVLKVGA